MIKVLL